MADNIMEIERQILLNTPHLVTPTPALLHSFNTDMTARLKSCRVNFNPVQEGTGDPSPDNVRPISGWTGVRLNRTGQNFITTNPLKKINRARVKESHTTIEYSAYQSLFVYPVPKGLLYLRKDANGSQYYNGLSDNPNLIVGNEVDEEWGFRWGSIFSKENNYNYLYASNATNSTYATVLSCTYGSYPSDGLALPAQEGLYLNVDWSSEAGTVYGGYVDLVRGELVKTNAMIEVSTSNTTIRTGSDVTAGNAYPYGRYMRTVLSGIKTGSGIMSRIKCDTLIGKSDNSFYNGETGFSVPSNTQPNIYWKTPDCATEEGATALRSSGIKFVYELKTPVTYQLDPVTIKTLRGLNNIWSDANGNIELSYWTH